MSNVGGAWSYYLVGEQERRIYGWPFTKITLLDADGITRQDVTVVDGHWTMGKPYDGPLVNPATCPVWPKEDE